MVQFKSPNAGLLFIVAGLACSRFKKEPTTQENVFQRLNLTAFHDQGIEIFTRENSTDVKSHSFSDSRLNFDPLSALELRLTDIIIREYRNATSQWQFKFIGVDESGTSRMHPHFQHPKDPTHVHRRVNVFLMDPAEGIPIWAVVNLSTLKVEGWIEGKLEEKEVEDELPDNVALFGNITPRHIYNMIFALVVVYTYRFFIFNYEEFGSMPTTGLHAVVAYYAWMHYIIVSSIVYYAALCFNRYYLPMFGN